MRSRLASAACALALLGGAAGPAVAFAPVAAAHSVLLSVDPADGATVDAAPDRVTLTFNEEINPSFVTVAVTGADRTDHVRGEAEVTGEQVSAGIGPLDDGEYTVGYRVTSADGHVITGSSRFVVEGGADEAPADGASSEGTAPAESAQAPAGSGQAPAESGRASDQAVDQEADQAAADDGSAGADSALWIVGGLALLLIVAAAFLLRRGGRGD